MSTIDILLAEGGCPWDKRQTDTSLVPYLLEETQELIDAIAKEDQDNICEELGDVLYLLLLITEKKRAQGRFSLDDVIAGVNQKLIRRHPHVFSDAEIGSEKELHEQWQRIKQEEKSQLRNKKK